MKQIVREFYKLYKLDTLAEQSANLPAGQIELVTCVYTLSEQPPHIRLCIISFMYYVLSRLCIIMYSFMYYPLSHCSDTVA